MRALKTSFLNLIQMGYRGSTIKGIIERFYELNDGKKYIGR